MSVPAAAAARGERSGQCDREFESVKSAIRKQHGADAPAEEGGALDLPGTDKSRRHRAAFRVSMNFDGEIQAVRSEAHLYCYVGGNWFVKYRITAPIAVTAPGAVDTFLRTGPWPGRGSARNVARLDPGRKRGTPLPAQR